MIRTDHRAAVAHNGAAGARRRERSHPARTTGAGAPSRTLPEHITKIQRADQPSDTQTSDTQRAVQGQQTEWTDPPKDRDSAPPAVSKTTALPIGEGLPRKRRRPRWWLAAVLLVLGVGVTGWWFSVGPGGTTTVPPLVGQTIDAADTAVEQASLRADTSEEFSETQAQGIVLRTSPSAGTEVSKQTNVLVVVSRGQERYAVPTVTGRKAGSVPATLAGRKLKPGATTEAYSETVATGLVISQQPLPGTSVRRGTPVIVVVSKGRQPIDVPPVTGVGADAATATIAASGLTVKRLDDANSDTVPAGQVISQTPAVGTLFRGGLVEITVSKGPVMVPVPGVVGRPVAEAEKALTDLGFTVKKEYPFGRLFDLVRVQSVEGGQSARQGATIVLTIV